MRFRTLWFSDISNTFTLREKLIRSRDILTMKVAARLPLRLKYWVTLQMVGQATAKSPNIPATPLDEILRNLKSPKVVS